MTEKKKDTELIIQIVIIAVLSLLLVYNIGKVSSGKDLEIIKAVSASDVIPAGTPKIYETFKKEKKERAPSELIGLNIALQNKNLELLEAMNNLTKRIDKLVNLFEEASKHIGEVQEDTKVNELATKLEELLQQGAKPVQQGFSQSIIAKDEIKASFLAQEAVEVIKNIRDSNQLYKIQNPSTSRTWLYKIAESGDPCGFGNTCRVVITTPTSGTYLYTCSGGWGSCNNLSQNQTNYIYAIVARLLILKEKCRLNQ